MKEILAPLLTPGVMVLLRFAMWALVVIYVANIVWVYRDAVLRTSMPWPWVILGVVPILGPILYMLLRPPMYAADAREQQLEIAKHEHELANAGSCPSCHYPIEPDFLICPNCSLRLKIECRACGRALRPSWHACPYCRTKVGS